jgi:hypothetical protein
LTFDCPQPESDSVIIHFAGLASGPEYHSQYQVSNGQMRSISRLWRLNLAAPAVPMAFARQLVQSDGGSRNPTTVEGLAATWALAPGAL